MMLEVTGRREGSGKSAAVRLAELVTSPRGAAAGPMATLGAYAAGGPDGMVVATGALVALYAGSAIVRTMAPSGELVRDHVTGLLVRDEIVSGIDGFMAGGHRGKTAAIVLQIDGFDQVVGRFGRDRADGVLKEVGERLSECCEEHDLVGRIQERTFAVVLAPQRETSLESVIQFSGRLQEAVSEPITVDSTRIGLTATVGFCLPARTPDAAGASVLSAAEAALSEAKTRGEGQIGAFSPEVQRRNAERIALMNEVSEAIDRDQIVPFFQPQISTETGELTGFEALARWRHPEKGLVPPGEFLHAAEEAGLLADLGARMLEHSLKALNAWDRAGFDVPSVGVNFTGDELSDPRLPDRIGWALDKHDLAPGRLTVEVLETVVAGSGDDVVSRNLAALSQMGCRIDLDDFGTGQASISNIRRFSINRLKIDRSFVTGADTDPEQRRMVSAILTMAERLDLDVLAEGIETPGEHEVISQLGCGHAQGFGIARPMAFEDAAPWMTRYAAKLEQTPTVALKAG